MFMEVVKAIIHDQYIPMHLWEEEAKIVVYVQKKSPHKVLENKTPEDIFPYTLQVPIECEKYGDRTIRDPVKTRRCVKRLRTRKEHEALLSQQR